MMKMFAISLLTAVFIAWTPAHATIWYVHPDSVLNSIQTALDYCADNDIVLVGQGTYYENIDWPNTQGIHLISELGPITTIIDADSVGRVMTIDVVVDTTTTIYGFTLQKGLTFHATPLAGPGAGIYCGMHSAPTIANNIITNNTAASIRGGGGIFCDTLSFPIITGNTITNNRTFWSIFWIGGGGINCHYSSPIIINNTIMHNTADYGAGIACDGPSSPLIADNLIAENESDEGGGIDCHHSSPIISNNIISDNVALRGAGICCDSICSPIIDSCIISNNTNEGVYCERGASPVIHYSNIIGNTSYGVNNVDSTITVDAKYNWWGDSSGPGGFGPGSGDEISEYVDYDPWLTEPVGVNEKEVIEVDHRESSATIFSGPLQLPKDKMCRVFDITGRVVAPDKLRPGIYFVEVEGKITQKVVKVR